MIEESEAMRPVRIKGVTRNEKNKCWLARISRRRWKYSEYFFDSRCGGKDEALRQAQAWYARTLAKLPDPISSKDFQTSRNKSGVVGVSRAVNIVERMGGTRYYHWVGRWTGNRAGKRFSILKYGDTGAFILACVARHLQTTDDAAIQQEYERWRRDGRANEMIAKRRPFAEPSTSSGLDLRGVSILS